MCLQNSSHVFCISLPVYFLGPAGAFQSCFSGKSVPGEESESESTCKLESEGQESPFQPVKKGKVQGESSIGELACMDVGVDQAGQNELVPIESHHLRLLAQFPQHGIFVGACVSAEGKLGGELKSY